MKKIIIAIIPLLILLGACKKKENTPTPTFEFVVNNVQDMTINAGADNVIALAIEYKSGNQEPVALSLSGLPSGASVEFSPKSGTPSYATTMKITTDVTVEAGSYPIKLIAKSSNGINKEYSFNLTIVKGALSFLTAATWKNISWGEDKNGDGKYQEGEAATPYEYMDQLSFSRDYTGFFKSFGGGVVDPFTWLLINETTLSFTYTDGGEASVITIAKLDASEFIMGFNNEGTTFFSKWVH